MKAVRRISGNDGHDQKYIVIAENGNVALGLYLRAARDHNREEAPYSLQGRLRAAAAPGCEATADDINSAFKGLPFEKFADPDCGMQRASCTVTFFTSQQERQGIPDALTQLNIGQRVIDFLAKGIPTKLLVMTAKEITEAVTGELYTHSTDESAGLALAQKIANTDEAFMTKIEAVCEALIQDLETAEAVYLKALTSAKEVADIASTVLIKAHAKKNPDFSFCVKETSKQEFGLASLAYDKGCDDVGDNHTYDA